MSFLHHFTPRTAHGKSHSLRLLFGVLPPLNSLDFFYIGQEQTVGIAKKEKPQSISKAVVLKNLSNELNKVAGLHGSSL